MPTDFYMAAHDRCIDFDHEFPAPCRECVNYTVRIELEAALAEARRDVERLNWWAANPWLFLGHRAHDIRDAIDAAMEKEKGDV